MNNMSGIPGGANSNKDAQRYGDISRSCRSAGVLKLLIDLANSAAKGYASTAETLRPFAQLDLLWLALAIIDTIAEQTELKPGTTRKAVTAALLSAVMEQNRAINPDSPMDSESIETGIGMMFDILANRPNRYKPFVTRHWDANRNQMSQRQFWLVKTTYDIEDAQQSALFELTPHAFSTYFGLLEQDAIDLARINVLRMQMLVDRGAFDRALEVASDNNNNARRLTSELRTIQRQIVRNIRSVDYDRVDFLGNEADEHSDALQGDLEKLSHMVRNYSPDKLDPSQEENLRLLSQKLDQQKLETDKLFKALISLPETYRDHQHKLFTSRDALADYSLPPLDSAAPLFAQVSVTQNAELADDFLATLLPPERRHLFSPDLFIENLEVALEQAPVSDAGEVEEVDEWLPQDYQSPFDELLQRDVMAWLQKTLSETGTTSVSTLFPLVEKELGNLAPRALQSIAMLCMQPESQEAFKTQSLCPDFSQRYQYRTEDKYLLHGHEITVGLISNDEI